MNVGVTQSVDVDIYIREGSDAISRVTGPTGDTWRSGLYPLYTEKEVIDMWADNAVRNGVQDANRLDGWSDLEDGEVTMNVVSSAIESYRKY